MKPEYTKGEWKVTNLYPGMNPAISVKNEGKALFDVCLDVYGHKPEEARANAHLIVLAPEMYELLRGLINDPEHFALLPPHYKNAVSRILAEAEGRQ